MMKSTGMTRKMDELGRIVIPKEIRDNLGFEEKQPVEFFVDGGSIVVRKYEVGCRCCGKVGATKNVMGIEICRDCASKIVEVFE